jgi:glycosyltransferase involved in cell wall biosynthesis
MSHPAGCIEPAPSVAVLLPAYNEALTIAQTVHAFRAALPEAAIWVIDNASSDDTGAIARRALDEAGGPGGVLAESRRGKANAVRRGLHAVEADIYLMCDADMTYPASRAADLIAPVAEGRADLVVGDRRSGGDYAAENKRPWHGVGNSLVQGLVNRMFRAELADILSGYRAMSRAFAKGYPIVVEGFEIETDLTLHALDKRFRILEIPVEYRDRPPGSHSKLHTFRDGARVLFVIAQVLRYYRPLLFFGLLSATVLVLGLVASVPVFDDWIRYRYIYHVPLAVLAAALVIVSVLMAVVGLVLDSVSHQQRMNYELGLLRHRRGE